jgi:hypothetical protein
VDFSLRRFGINDAINAQSALQADHWKPCVGSRREGLTLAADRRQPFGRPMTRNNARIIAQFFARPME